MLSLKGIATSGAFFYNHKDANNQVAATTEGETFDTCMGHADPMCRKVFIEYMNIYIYILETMKSITLL